MKKIFMLLVGMWCAFFVTSVAAGMLLVPEVINGSDVLVPGMAIDTVAKNANPEVIAVMHDIRGKNHKIPMVKDGDSWIAPGAADQDFHPVVIRDGKAYWAKVEDVWEIGLYMNKRESNLDFIVWRGEGKPCFNVKQK